jgi:hypothetical protein
MARVTLGRVIIAITLHRSEQREHTRTSVASTRLSESDRERLRSRSENKSRPDISGGDSEEGIAGARGSLGLRFRTTALRHLAAGAKTSW